MNWFTNWIKQPFKPFKSSNIPDDLWHKCIKCSDMIFKKQIIDNLFVCTVCDHHNRISAKDRLNIFFDKIENQDNNFEEINIPSAEDDPIKFKDKITYKSRLKKYREKCQANDCFSVGIGQVGKKKAIALSMDFGFIGGSMGRDLGNAIVHASKLAVEYNIPLITFSSSGGARMQEGIFSLIQMARTTIAVKQVREAGLAYISVLCDPTTGGVQASFTMLGTIILAEPNALIGFAGARVIRQTIGEDLPDDFQSSEFQLKNGFIDQIIHRNQMRNTISKILNILS